MGNITSADIKRVNESINTIDIGRGKQYAVVAERVKAFRQLQANGAIETEIIGSNENEVTVKASIRDNEGKLLATGTAHEVKGAGMVNKTSWVENCETSAVGRALAFVGIGIEGEIASAEEMVNAETEATKAKLGMISAKEKKILENMCKDRELDIDKTFPLGLDLTGAQYQAAVEKLSKIEVKKK